MADPDLTRKVPEQAGGQLRPTEEPARKVLDTIPVQIWTALPDGTFDYCNSQSRAYTGLSQEEFRAHGWPQTLHPDDRDAALKAWHESVANGAPFEVQARHRRADGVYRWFLCRGLPLRDAEGRVERWYGVNTDVEDHKLAGEALHIAHVGHWEHDLEARRITASDEAYRIFGSSPRQSLQTWAAWQEPLHPEDLGIRDAAIERLLREGSRYEAEYRVVRPDGQVRIVYSRGDIERDAAGRPRRLFGIVQDVTDRKQAEEALRRSEELLQRTETMAHVGGWTLAVADGTVTASEEGRRLFGWAPGPRRLDDLMALVHPDDRPGVAAAMQAALGGTPFETEHRIVVNGEVKWIRRRVEPELDPSGHLARLVGVSQDITGRRKLEEQFRQAQKMEAVGTLAGGVAHDFNNLLTIISGYTDLLLETLKPGDPARDLVAEIHKAGERAGSLTRQLLTFSRRQVVEPRVLDLNAVVADTEKMLRRLVGEDVVLTATLDPSLAPVKADPGQLQQVLMNLAVNARDAMPQGGRLTIETRNVTLDEGYADTHPRVRPGEYVLLAVSDTGTGIDAPTRARIFEPFFTTKGPGKGTGLGLAVVHGVVAQSEGQIEVYSEVGQGTAFKVYLPAAREGVPAGKPFPGPHPLPRGNETVLLVEDEDAVRALARHVLTSCGYTVLEAADGQEAVGVAEQHPGRIDLVASDVVMPHLGGRQLVERLAALKPGLKVLFLSGYADDAVIRHGVLGAEYAFLQKPFTPTALAQKVREVLGVNSGITH